MKKTTHANKTKKSTAAQVAPNRVRGRGSKGARGRQRKEREAREAIERRREARGGEDVRGPSSEAALREAARRILSDLGIPETSATVGIASQHVRLLEWVDRAACAPIDGRAGGAIRMCSQEAREAMEQLLRIAEHSRAVKRYATPPDSRPVAPAAGAAQPVALPAEQLDDWGMPR